MKTIITVILSCCTILTFGQTKEEYKKIGDSLLNLGLDEQYIKYFEKELMKNPKNEEVLRILGFYYIEENKFELGEKYYTQAITVNPKCGRCYMNISRIYAAKKDNIKALELLDKSITVDPIDAMLYSMRAQLKETTGDKMGALFDLDKAIKLEPENFGYYIQRGKYYIQKGYSSLAMTDLSMAIEKAPNNCLPYYERANLYYDKKMYQEALNDINTALKIDSTVPILYTGRGAVYSLLKNHNKAIDDYDKAIALDSTNYFSYYERALERYAMEDMDGACSDNYISYELLKKQDPENELIKTLEYAIGNYCDSTKPSYYYQRGIANYNLKQYDKAINIYTIGLKKFPTNSMTLSFRGNAYFMAKNYENALLNYAASIQNKENLIYDVEANQKHTKIDSEGTATYINTIIASMQISIAECKMALGQYEEALIEINKGIAIATDVKEFGKENYYNVRGNIYLATGKYQLALNDFDECIKYNPYYIFALVNGAIAKVNLSNQIKMKSYTIEGAMENQTFTANWDFATKTSKIRLDKNIISALDDCNKAMSIEPKLGHLYYIRGQIKIMLDCTDYCHDLIKAKELHYPVESELLRDCIK